MHTVICIQLLFQFVVMWIHTLCQTGLHTLKQTEPLPWGSMGFIPDRGWCSEENQCMKSASDQHEQSGVWRRMVGQGLCRDNTYGFQDSRQGSSQCCSLRAWKRGHVSGCRRKHRGRGRRLDGTQKPQRQCPCAGLRVFLGDTEQPCGY